MTLEEYIFRRLVYVKRLYIHGAEHAESGTQVDLALAILNFDNALEMLLYATLEFLGHSIKNKGFHELLNSVNEVIKKERPNVNIDKILCEREVKNLHTARNNVQHHGVIPSAEDIKRFQVLTEYVITHIIKEIFGISVLDISLGHLIKDKMVRELYLHADNAYLSKNYSEALIYCVATFETAKNKEQDRIYGSGLTFMRLSVEDKRLNRSMKPIIEYIDALTEEVEVLKLRLDYKKYQKYRSIIRATELTPSYRMTSYNIDSIITETKKLLNEKIQKTGAQDLKGDVEFCLNFAIESILRWESVLREAWYEPLRRTINQFLRSRENAEKEMTESERFS